MEAHEIIDTTMVRGEAEELKRLTGKSVELFNSYRRSPRTPENPLATGNYSPVYHYLEYFHLRRAANPSGALKMHQLVSAEIEESLTNQAGDNKTTLNEHSIDILEKTTRAIRKMNEEDIESADRHDLLVIDTLLGDLESEVQEARARVRAERRRREGSLKSMELGGNGVTDYSSGVRRS